MAFTDTTAAATAASPLTYVITGASRGHCLEFVRQLSHTDNIIFSLARNPENARDPLALVKENKNIHAVKLDVWNEATIKTAAEEVAKFAPYGIDILINNSDIGSDGYVTTLNITKNDYIRVLETNVIGVSDATQAFLPLLRQQKDGQAAITTKNIVNITSSLGPIANMSDYVANVDASPAYNISKAAFNMMTKLTSIDLAKNEKTKIWAAVIHPVG